MNAVITDHQIRQFASAIAKELNPYVAMSESKTIEVDYDLGAEQWLTATVDYQCKIGKDKGTPWAPPSWWVEEEVTKVTSVKFNDRECPDLICALEFYLN